MRQMQSGACAQMQSGAYAPNAKRRRLRAKCKAAALTRRRWLPHGLLENRDVLRGKAFFALAHFEGNLRAFLE